MINKNEYINQFKVLDPSSGAPMPRPIAPIECKCGCGIIFQPKRKDQIYLNKQHADFAYNHGKRKEISRNRLFLLKMIRFFTNTLLVKRNQKLFKGILMS